jgi:hypothetical protein
MRTLTRIGYGDRVLAIDYSEIGMGFVVIFLDAPRKIFRKTKPVVMSSPMYRLRLQSNDCDDRDFPHHRQHPF